MLLLTIGTQPVRKEMRCKLIGTEKEWLPQIEISEDRLHIYERKMKTSGPRRKREIQRILFQKRRKTKEIKQRNIPPDKHVKESNTLTAQKFKSQGEMNLKVHDKRKIFTLVLVQSLQKQQLQPQIRNVLQLILQLKNKIEE